MQLALSHAACMVSLHLCLARLLHPMCLHATLPHAEDEPAGASGEPAAAAAEQQAGEAGPSSSKPSGSKKRKAAGGEGEGWGKIEEGLSGGWAAAWAWAPT